MQEKALKTRATPQSDADTWAMVDQEGEQGTPRAVLQRRILQTSSPLTDCCTAPHRAKLAQPVLQPGSRAARCPSTKWMPQSSARFSFGWRWTAQFSTLQKCLVSLFPPSRWQEKTIQVIGNLGGGHVCWHSAALHGMMKCQVPKWFTASGLCANHNVPK